MASNNAPKCGRDGCDCEAALNSYYPNSEGGQFWTLCEQCFRMADGDEYDELRVVEDFNNSGNTAEENEAEQAEMFAAMAKWGTNWRQHLPEMTQEEIVARRQRQEAIGAGLVAPGQVCEDDDEEDEQRCDGCGTTCLDHTSNKGRGSESPCEECEETRCKLCPCACEENQLLEEFWDGGMKEMWGEELREGHPLWEPFKLYKAMKKEQDA